MKMLRIKQCRDPLMWYAGMVGQDVPFCGQWPEAYKSREPAGYINRVEFDDADVVDVHEELPRRIVHMRTTGAPLCGQVDARGRGWSNGPRTDDTGRVTCKKCMRKLGLVTPNLK